MPGQISEITNGNPVCNAANSDTGRLVTNARCDRIAVETAGRPHDSMRTVIERKEFRNVNWPATGCKRRSGDD